MLFNESRFTPLTIDIKNQIKRLINTFVKNNIEKKGKLSNLTLDQSKKNVKKMINRSKGKEILIGNIFLGKQLNKYIPIFIKETGSGGTYYQESDDFHEHIVIAFDTIFEDLEYILSVLAHEVIHAIQKYKKASAKYYEITNKVVSGSQANSEEMFVYYTEPSEFEANASQLSYIIVRFYERKDIDKSKVMYILESFLTFPKTKMNKFFNSFFIRYFMQLSYEDQEIYMSYLREMFLSKIEFLKAISESPDNKSSNIKKSNRYWKQFKQKLFTLVQNLKKRHLKHQEKNK